MRWLALFMTMLAWPALGVAAGDPFPGVAAAYLLRVDGRDLWSHDPDRPLPPASLTKMMTALLMMEKRQPEEVVTIGNRAAAVQGSRLGVVAGERYLLRDLVAALLIGSANDACIALAEHVAGSEKGFVQMMNRRAGELGLSGTHFANACGFDGAGHFSTARDLATLATAALRNPPFAAIVGLARHRVAPLGGHRSFMIENKNALIGRFPGAVGVKTGFTADAGPCLVALARRNGREALLVILNAPNRWWDAEAILDRALKGGNEP